MGRLPKNGSFHTKYKTALLYIPVLVFSRAEHVIVVFTQVSVFVFLRFLPPTQYSRGEYNCVYCHHLIELRFKKFKAKFSARQMKLHN